MKGRRRGVAYRGSKVSFGDYGLQALEPGWIKSRQIEAARVAITLPCGSSSVCRRSGRLWVLGRPLLLQPAGEILADLAEIAPVVEPAQLQQASSPAFRGT